MTHCCRREDARPLSCCSVILRLAAHVLRPADSAKPVIHGASDGVCALFVPDCGTRDARLSFAFAAGGPIRRFCRFCPRPLSSARREGGPQSLGRLTGCDGPVSRTGARRGFPPPSGVKKSPFFVRAGEYLRHFFTLPRVFFGTIFRTVFSAFRARGQGEPAPPCCVAEEERAVFARGPFGLAAASLPGPCLQRGPGGRQRQKACAPSSGPGRPALPPCPRNTSSRRPCRRSPAPRQRGWPCPD